MGLDDAVAGEEDTADEPDDGETDLAGQPGQETDQEHAWVGPSWGGVRPYGRAEVRAEGPAQVGPEFFGIPPVAGRDHPMAAVWVL
ncbi:hypothetical protein GCM10010276_51620 [Streptomyces longisporus]|uniref:Uncharacterized protein n=1 Tax=Streptomyces longisporus TaxID=1948 RepID=A0ABP5ZPY5_STRLO